MKAKKTALARASYKSEAAHVVTIKKSQAEDLLRRLAKGRGGTEPSDSDGQDLTCSASDQWNAALGCKTDEVALQFLAQVVNLEPGASEASEAEIDRRLMQATAVLAEIEPTTATEGLLAVQMIGTQRAAMGFLTQAMLADQTFQGRDANVLRATRLMRLFNEQVDTMARLKGKGGQQRVVVEHVTVAAGGRAIVGTVTPGGRGESGGNRR